MESSELSKIVKSGHVAFVVVDMQGDYCQPGYYMDKAGYAVEQLRKPIPYIAQTLSAARANNIPVIYTRQYRVAKDDEAGENFPLTSLKDEPGWEIIPELKPQPDDSVLDKTTCSVFVSTDIDKLLKQKGITTLIFCGNTIDVCVHSSLRTANDLGYKCITIADACGAVNEDLHHWSLESIKVEDGVFGSVVYSKNFIDALK